MDVNVTKAATGQQISVNEFQNFLIRSSNCRRKIVQRIEYLAAISQMPNSDFTNHERMYQDPARGKKQR